MARGSHKASRAVPVVAAVGPGSTCRCRHVAKQGCWSQSPHGPTAADGTFTSVPATTEDVDAGGAPYHRAAPASVGGRPKGRSIFDLIAPLVEGAITNRADARPSVPSSPVQADSEGVSSMGPEPAMQLVAPGQPCPICRTGATRCTISGCPMAPAAVG